MKDEAEEQYEVDELVGVKGFAGRYNIERELGAGSYGRVYKAVDTHFGESGITRAVALKVLKPMSRRSEGDRYGDGRKERFLREARMVASLKDDRIVEIYDKGEKNGLVFAAYEYVEGETLAEYLNRGKVFSPLEWVKLLEQILDALAEAHSRDIVHRDIKPANLMITSHKRRGYEVKVLDFGIGKYVGSDEHVRRDFDTMTNVGEAVGTERYMSPQQFKGEAPTAAADVWALGLVSVGALTGQLALPAEGPTLMYQIVDDAPLEVAPDLSHVPGHLREVIDRMLEKDLSKRYENAQEVLRDLEELKGASSGWEHSGLVQSVGTDEDEGGTNETTPEFASDTVPEPVRADFVGTKPVEAQEAQTETSEDGSEKRKSAGWPVVGAAAVVLLIAGAWVVWPEDEPNTEPPSAAVLRSDKEMKGVEEAEAQESVEETDELKTAHRAARKASGSSVGSAVKTAREAAVEVTADVEPKAEGRAEEAPSRENKTARTQASEEAPSDEEDETVAKRAEERPKQEKGSVSAEKEVGAAGQGEKEPKEKEAEGEKVSVSADEIEKQKDKEASESKAEKKPIIWGVE